MISWLEKLGLGLKKSSQKIGGGISGIFTKRKLDAETLEELEELLIASDMGVRTAAAIVGEFSKMRQDKEISEQEIREKLAAELEKLLQPCERKFAVAEGKRPFVILMAGVNGAGKTTTIGKLANNLRQQGKKVLLAAADTFRAAAIDQLQIWADRAQVDLVRHEEGSDPAAVVFDAINAGTARGCDVVICDTAGRLHNKKNLMDELSKIARVIEREAPGCAKEVLLVLDATTGQNALNQAKLFREAAGLTGLVLTKLDGTARGGVVIGIREELDIPIKYIGVGEQIDDLRPFDPVEFANALFQNTEDKDRNEQEEA